MKHRLTQALAAHRERVQHAIARAGAIGTHDRCFKLALDANARKGAKPRVNGGRIDDGQRAELLQPGRKGCRVAGLIDPIGQPNEVCAALLRRQRCFQRGRRRQPIGRKRLRHECSRRGARIQWRFKFGGNGFRCGRRRQQHHRPPLGFGLRDQPVDQRRSLRKPRRTCPAVVDRDHDRPGALQARFPRRVHHRFGQRADHKRCRQQPDQHQPPGRLGRRLVLVLEPDQNSRGRERHLLGARGHRAQQPIDHRQRCECRQQPGIEEHKRAHQLSPRGSAMGLGAGCQRAPSSLPCKRTMRASSGSDGGRSV